MKIPKYIEQLIDKRTKLVEQLIDVTYDLDCWLDKHCIECEFEDTHGGVEIYFNPYESGERVKQVIKNK